MASNKFDIYVYADWKGLEEPKTIGLLSAHYGKGKKVFSFEYDKSWIQSKQQLLLDPDIQFFKGTQFPNNKENFGVFLDSMPDTWGRTLMKRRSVEQAKENNIQAPLLYDIDVHVITPTKMKILQNYKIFQMSTYENYKK